MMNSSTTLVDGCPAATVPSPTLSLSPSQPQPHREAAINAPNTLLPPLENIYIRHTHQQSALNSSLSSSVVVARVGWHVSSSQLVPLHAAPSVPVESSNATATATATTNNTAQMLPPINHTHAHIHVDTTPVSDDPTRPSMHVLSPLPLTSLASLRQSQWKSDAARAAAWKAAQYGVVQPLQKATRKKKRAAVIDVDDYVDSPLYDVCDVSREIARDLSASWVRGAAQQTLTQQHNKSFVKNTQANNNINSNNNYQPNNNVSSNTSNTIADMIIQQEKEREKERERQLELEKAKKNESGSSAYYALVQHAAARVAMWTEELDADDYNYAKHARQANQNKMSNFQIVNSLLASLANPEHKIFEEISYSLSQQQKQEGSQLRQFLQAEWRQGDTEEEIEAAKTNLYSVLQDYELQVLRCLNSYYTDLQRNTQIATRLKDKYERRRRRKLREEKKEQHDHAEEQQASSDDDADDKDDDKDILFDAYHELNFDDIEMYSPLNTSVLDTSLNALTSLNLLPHQHHAAHTQANSSSLLHSSSSGHPSSMSLMSSPDSIASLTSTLLASSNCTSLKMKYQLLLMILSSKCSEARTILASYVAIKGLQNQFELKLVPILHSIKSVNQQLMCERANTARIEHELEELSARLKQLQALGSSDAIAELRAREVSDAARVELSAWSNEVAVISEAKREQDEAAIKQQQNNQELSNKIKRLESEMAHLHKQRENDKIHHRMLDSKMKKEVSMVMNGQVPEYLREEIDREVKSEAAKLSSRLTMDVQALQSVLNGSGLVNAGIVTDDKIQTEKAKLDAEPDDESSSDSDDSSVDTPRSNPTPLLSLHSSRVDSRVGSRVSSVGPSRTSSRAPSRPATSLIVATPSQRPASTNSRSHSLSINRERAAANQSRTINSRQQPRNEGVEALRRIRDSIRQLHDYRSVLESELSAQLDDMRDMGIPPTQSQQATNMQTQSAHNQLHQQLNDNEVIEEEREDAETERDDDHHHDDVDHSDASITDEAQIGPAKQASGESDMIVNHSNTHLTSSNHSHVSSLPASVVVDSSLNPSSSKLVAKSQPVKPLLRKSATTQPQRATKHIKRDDAHQPLSPRDQAIIERQLKAQLQELTIQRDKLEKELGRLNQVWQKRDAAEKELEGHQEIIRSSQHQLDDLMRSYQLLLFECSHVGMSFDVDGVASQSLIDSCVSIPSRLLVYPLEAWSVEWQLQDNTEQPNNRIIKQTQSVQHYLEQHPPASSADSSSSISSLSPPNGFDVSLDLSCITDGVARLSSESGSLSPSPADSATASPPTPALSDMHEDELAEHKEEELAFETWEVEQKVKIEEEINHLYMPRFNRYSKKIAKLRALHIEKSSVPTCSQAELDMIIEKIGKMQDKVKALYVAKEEEVNQLFASRVEEWKENWKALAPERQARRNQLRIQHEQQLAEQAAMKLKRSEESQKKPVSKRGAPSLKRAASTLHVSRVHSNTSKRHLEHGAALHIDRAASVIKATENKKSHRKSGSKAKDILQGEATNELKVQEECVDEIDSEPTSSSTLCVDSDTAAPMSPPALQRRSSLAELQAELQSHLDKKNSAESLQQQSAFNQLMADAANWKNQIMAATNNVDSHITPQAVTEQHSVESTQSLSDNPVQLQQSNLALDHILDSSSSRSASLNSDRALSGESSYESQPSSQPPEQTVLESHGTCEADAIHHSLHQLDADNATQQYIDALKASLVARSLGAASHAHMNWPDTDDELESVNHSAQPSRSSSPLLVRASATPINTRSPLPPSRCRSRASNARSRSPSRSGSDSHSACHSPSPPTDHAHPSAAILHPHLVFDMPRDIMGAQHEASVAPVVKSLQLASRPMRQSKIRRNTDQTRSYPNHQVKQGPRGKQILPASDDNHPSVGADIHSSTLTASASDPALVTANAPSLSSSDVPPLSLSSSPSSPNLTHRSSTRVRRKPHIVEHVPINTFQPQLEVAHSKKPHSSFLFQSVKHSAPTAAAHSAASADNTAVDSSPMDPVLAPVPSSLHVLSLEPSQLPSFHMGQHKSLSHSSSNRSRSTFDIMHEPMSLLGSAGLSAQPASVYVPKGVKRARRNMVANMYDHAFKGGSHTTQQQNGVALQTSTQVEAAPHHRSSRSSHLFNIRSLSHANRDVASASTSSPPSSHSPSRPSSPLLLSFSSEPGSSPPVSPRAGKGVRLKGRSTSKYAAQLLQLTQNEIQMHALNQSQFSNLISASHLPLQPSVAPLPLSTSSTSLTSESLSTRYESEHIITPSQYHQSASSSDSVMLHSDSTPSALDLSSNSNSSSLTLSSSVSAAPLLISPIGRRPITFTHSASQPAIHHVSKRQSSVILQPSASSSALIKPAPSSLSSAHLTPASPSLLPSSRSASILIPSLSLSSILPSNVVLPTPPSLNAYIPSVFKRKKRKPVDSILKDTLLSYIHADNWRADDELSLELQRQSMPWAAPISRTVHKAKRKVAITNHIKSQLHSQQHRIELPLLSSFLLPPRFPAPIQPTPLHSSPPYPPLTSRSQSQLSLSSVSPWVNLSTSSAAVLSHSSSGDAPHLLTAPAFKSRSHSHTVLPHTSRSFKHVASLPTINTSHVQPYQLKHNQTTSIQQRDPETDPKPKSSISSFTSTLFSLPLPTAQTVHDDYVRNLMRGRAVGDYHNVTIVDKSARSHLNSVTPTTSSSSSSSSSSSFSTSSSIVVDSLPVVSSSISSSAASLDAQYQHHQQPQAHSFTSS